jgi:hypothetical protein
MTEARKIREKIFTRERMRIPLFFLSLTLISTYPLIFKLGRSIYGHGQDPMGTLWKFWWLRYSHYNAISEDVISIIAAPFGIDFSRVAFWTLHLPLAKWFSILINEVFAFNFILLLGFFLAPLFMYFLVYYLTRDKIASCLAGIIYGFSPYHFAHAAQHLELASIQWLPLYFLTLFKLDEKRNYRNACFFALTFSLVALFHPYYGCFAALFTGLFLLWRIGYGVRRKRDYRLKDLTVLLVALLLILAITLPFFHSVIRDAFFLSKEEIVVRERYVKPFRDLFSSSARSLNYLLPFRDNPILGGITRYFLDSHFYGSRPIEHTLYLGWTNIILALVAVRTWRRRRKENSLLGGEGERTRQEKAVPFFLLVTIGALLFSYAPWHDFGPWRILFPSYFMYKFLPMFRNYARFGIMVILAISVLAGIGLSFLLKRRSSLTHRTSLVFFVSLFLFIEFIPPLPAPTINATRVPPVYRWLAKKKGDFIIAEYPLVNDQSYLFNQRLHKKKLFNGSRGDTTAEKVRKEIGNLTDPRTPGILSHLGVKYIILHSQKYLMSEDVPIMGQMPDLENISGLQLVESFPQSEIYRITALPLNPQLTEE